MHDADGRAAKGISRGDARRSPEIRSMFVSRTKTLLASGVVSACLLIGAARGDDAAAAIAKLLDVGWSISPQARLAADAQYEEVVRLAVKDVRGLEASWLVLMQQRRFDDALDRLCGELGRTPRAPHPL